MFIITTCRGKKAAFIPQDISAFTETGTEKRGVYVYIRGEPDPFHADCTFEEFLEMYETALNSATPGHISNTRVVPQAVIEPQPTETPEQREARLQKLDKFQQDLRLMFPEAYVFVKNPDGTWLYNTATAVVSMDGEHWKSWAPDPEGLEPVGLIGWKTVDSEICEEWREELKWLNWQASVFYGQRHDLQADTFEPFAGREP